MTKSELETRLSRFKQSIGTWDTTNKIKSTTLRATVKAYEAFLESELVRYSLQTKTQQRENLRLIGHIPTLRGNNLRVTKVVVPTTTPIMNLSK